MFRPTIFFLALATLGLSACASLSTPTLPEGQVRTQQGVAQGTISDGIISWRGIEYARAQRWALPGRAPNWTGVKTANAHGPSCPQAGQTDMVEDCLFLNVFAPQNPKQQQKRPVLVWFHGGGFRAGSGGDAPRLWAKEGLVTVSFNYRLGVLGFRDWAGWDADDPRNFGQADMVAALEWVRDNISAFGGDPNNVTIHGHSAGGMAVALMLVDARARGFI
ncbi:MAG: carboxylesterase family protein [Hyphomonadaceae bacterium]|nr:carboxylesterase family protein [Hyphomonadaceae bacterium]